jgi:hypothetical protein
MRQHLPILGSEAERIRAFAHVPSVLPELPIDSGERGEASQSVSLHLQTPHATTARNILGCNFQVPTARARFDCQLSMDTGFAIHLAELNVDDARSFVANDIEGLRAQIQMICHSTAMPCVWALVRHSNCDSA